MRTSNPLALAPGALQAILLTFLAVGCIATARAAVPTISGTPQTRVTLGHQFLFRPAARDADGNTLRFSVTNKPNWATFSTTSGQLQGMPGRTGTWSNIRISVSDGTATVSLPLFAVNVVSSGSTSNRAPTISGTPATSATVGSGYSFRPSAADADGNSLGFSIQNRPAWASFNTTTGQLLGTPAAAHVGTYPNIVIRVNDGRVSAALPAFGITVRAASSSNTAPTIGGAPATSIRAGSAYGFTPTARDVNGDTLTFGISNKPAWAAFNTSTGRLSGTPTSAQIGTYSSIVIRVNDGRATAYLPAFAITVSDVANGTATLSWTPPTRNTNGSTLTNLAGYRIYYGTSSSALNRSIQVSNPGLASYVVENLSPATYYFAVKAYNTAGTESANSNVASKVVR